MANMALIGQEVTETPQNFHKQSYLRGYVSNSNLNMPITVKFGSNQWPRTPLPNLVQIREDGGYRSAPTCGCCKKLLFWAFFRPTWLTIYTSQSEIWHGSMCNFTFGCCWPCCQCSTDFGCCLLFLV